MKNAMGKREARNSESATAKPQATAPKPKKPRRRGARGVLWIIALMLAMSGLLRLGGESGRAIASGLATAVIEPTQDNEGCTPPADVAEVLVLLQARDAAVSAREAAVADRMQALAVAEAQIAKNMAALQDAEASLEATMALASTAAEDDLSRLTSVYENMKAKEAAPLFAAMAPQFAAGFLGRMRPDAAAAILAKLDPEAAYSISVLLAGRNAGVPTE
jgi:flagellar motility protein MotE (MotC chaperone)